MARGQGGYYTNNLDIATADQLGPDMLVAVDTQSDGGSAPQSLAVPLNLLAGGDTGIIAAAGATQGTATPIVNTNTIVTVSASTEGVILPSVSLGLKYTVIVPGTKGVKVYPASGDKISTGATDAAVALAADNGNIYVGIDDTTWALITGA